MQDADIIVPWLAISNTGLWCIVVLLITYACSPWLPQRNNPYLVNFFLATLIAAIPPSLLFVIHIFAYIVPDHTCPTVYTRGINIRQSHRICAWRNSRSSQASLPCESFIQSHIVVADI